MVIWLVVGVTGYFRVSPETAALRASLMQSVPGTWHKKIALSVGSVTTGLVRAGSRFINMPSEPRAALDALHGAEVGIYRLEEEVAVNKGAALQAADKAMKSRGWDRIVGVVGERELVAVYFPRKASPRDVKCCVLVFQGCDLVVASVRGNLEPLVQLAHQHMDLGELKRHLPAGI